MAGDENSPLADHRAVARAVRLAVAFAWLAMLAGGRSARAPSSQLQVTERWSTKGAPEMDEFVSIAGMAEAMDGRSWLADGMGGQLFVLSADGEVIGRSGRRADGPGEFLLPGRLVRTLDGRLALHDEGRSAVDVLEDGRLVRRVQLTARVINSKGFAALPDGGWLVSGGIEGNPYAIHRFDADGALRVSWFPIPKTENPRAGVMVAGGPVAALEGGVVLFARAAPHAIYRFEAPGSDPALVAAFPNVVPAIGDDFIQEHGTGRDLVRLFKWFFPQSRAILPVSGERMLNVVTRHEDRESLWYLLGQHGEVLASAVVAVAYVPWGLTSDGDILASYLDSETDESYAARLSVRLADGPRVGAGLLDTGVVRLEPIVVTAPAEAAPVARLAKYHERLAKRKGLFVTREEIEERRPRALWQMLYGLPSLDIVERDQTVTNRRTRCAPALYLDGSYLGNATVPKLHSIPPSTVEGIEFFRGPAETPFEFSGLGAMCGVIAVWTRSG